MSLWHGHDPWPLADEPDRPTGQPEPPWELTALGLLIALLLVACMLGGKLDRTPGATIAPEGDHPELMYDVRRALEQMSRQA